jgi:hypothetical protein
MLFEKASRLKLRFQSTKGILSTEDLWDLSLQDLNALAKKLNRQIKNMSEEDFLQEETKEDKETKLAFDLVIHVLNVKKEERQKEKDRTEKKAKKEKLLDILAKKRDQSLEQMSEEDLLKELESL